MAYHSMLIQLGVTLIQPVDDPPERVMVNVTRMSLSIPGMPEIRTPPSSTPGSPGGEDRPASDVALANEIVNTLLIEARDFFDGYVYT